MAWLLVVVPVVAACGGESGNSASARQASASCVAPYLNDQPSNDRFRSPPLTVRPGATLTVYGHWYTSTCNDTGTRGRTNPLPPVQLIVTLPDGKTARLGPFTPGGRDMGFMAHVHIHAATRAGTVTIRDDRAPHPSSYQFTVVA